MLAVSQVIRCGFGDVQVFHVAGHVHAPCERKHMYGAHMPGELLCPEGFGYYPFDMAVLVKTGSGGVALGYVGTRAGHAQANSLC